MLQVLLARIMARTLSCLSRDGLLIRDDEQPWLDLEARDALDSFSAASVQYRVALGADAGQRTRKLRLAAPASSVPLVKPLTVAGDGFSLPLHLKTGRWPSKPMSATVSKGYVAM